MYVSPYCNSVQISLHRLFDHPYWDFGLLPTEKDLQAYVDCLVPDKRNNGVWRWDREAFMKKTDTDAYFYKSRMERIKRCRVDNVPLDEEEVNVSN
jgi:hypothetical protein